MNCHKATIVGLILASLLLGGCSWLAPSQQLHQPDPAKAAGILTIAASVDSPGKLSLVTTLVNQHTGLGTVYLAFENGMEGTTGNIEALVDFHQVAVRKPNFNLPLGKKLVRVDFKTPNDSNAHDLRLVVSLNTVSKASASLRTFGIAGRIGRVDGPSAAIIAESVCMSPPGRVRSNPNLLAGPKLVLQPRKQHLSTSLLAELNPASSASGKAVMIFADHNLLPIKPQQSCIFVEPGESLSFSFDAQGRVEYEMLSWSLAAPQEGQVALQGVDALESSPRI